MNTIRIKSPDGKGNRTTVELDGVNIANSLMGLTFKASSRGHVVTLEMIADVEIEAEAAIVKRWRKVKQDADARKAARS